MTHNDKDLKAPSGFEMDKAVDGPAKWGSSNKPIPGSLKGLTETLSGMSQINKILGSRKIDLSAALKTDLSHVSEGMKSMMDGLDRQKDLFVKLDSVRAPNIAQDFSARLRIPEPPPSPIHETNDRLAELEVRLQAMTDIMEEGMKIAASQQEVAAESAKLAIDNARIAKDTMMLTRWAVGISVAAIVVPLLYSFLSDKGQEQTVRQISNEFQSLKEAEVRGSLEIAKALEKSESSIVEAIKSDRVPDPTTVAQVRK